MDKYRKKQYKYAYYVCDRCNNFLRIAREETFNHLLCAKCSPEINRLINLDISFLIRIIDLHKNITLKKIQPSLCDGCHQETMVKYGGASKCFSCQATKFTPQMFGEDISVDAICPTLEKISKKEFELQRQGKLMIFKIINPFTGEIMYIIWQIPQF